MTKHFSLLALLVGAQAFSATGSTFSEVWSQVSSDPYALPHNRVTLGSFYAGFKDILQRAGQRTIADHTDVLPRFTKLVHPNGICLAGTWNITEENPYSGYFAKGSRGLIIARASVAMSETVRGQDRGFGFAGKLFPTTHADHADKLPTANFFLVDDLGGTKLPHYTDATMSNHPTTTSHFSVLAIGAAALKAFSFADKNPTVRQMYEVAELGLADTMTSHTPVWFELKAQPGQTVEAADFRDELRVANYGGHLRFDIFVATGVKAPRQRIGFVEFTQDVVSDSCDHRLHFHHPKWRKVLR